MTCRYCTFPEDNVIHRLNPEECSAEGRRLGIGECMAPLDHHTFEADTRDLTREDWDTILYALGIAGSEVGDEDFEEVRVKVQGKVAP